MGSCQSRGMCETTDLDKSLLIKIGCDTKGSVLCNDNELNCLNGGVCALFKADTDLKCIPQCRCTPEYYGQNCESSTAFLANYGLATGIFIALIFTIILTILIWYCCCRKRKKEEVPDAPERSPRVYLTNRFDTSHAAPMPDNHHVESGKATPYETALGTQGNDNYTLQSCNSYDGNGQTAMQTGWVSGWGDGAYQLGELTENERTQLLSRPLNLGGNQRLAPTSPHEVIIGPVS